jgi:beta-lactamase class A
MSARTLQLSNDELARVSVALVDVDRVTRFDHRSGAQCYAASIMKLAVAVAVLRELDRGVLSPDDLLLFDGGFASGLDGSRFTIDDDSVDPDLCVEGSISGHGSEEPLDGFPAHWVRRFGTSSPAGGSATAGSGLAGSGVAGSGVASAVAPGSGVVTVARALCRSITVSSNEGANLLMQAVGLEAVNSVLDDSGCKNSVVERMVFDTAARDAGRTNLLTALDAAQLMWSIRFGVIVDRASLAFLSQVLRLQTQRSMIPFALHDPLQRGEVVVGNKEGQTNEVLHDVAFVEPDDADPFVLAVCTSGLTELDATLAVRKVATYAYENRFLWKSLKGGVE